MTFRPWYEIKEVAEIVDTFDDDVSALFKKNPPQWWFINMFESLYFELNMILNDIKVSQNWNCYK